MKLLKRFAIPLIALATLCLPPAGHAGPLQDCADPDADPADFSDCLARRQRNAMRRLEEAREGIAELARARGPDALESHRRAETSFDLFVQAACLDRVRMSSEEALGEDLRRDCVIRLLEWRADDLESLADEVSDGG